MRNEKLRIRHITNYRDVLETIEVLFPLIATNIIEKGNIIQAICETREVERGLRTSRVGTKRANSSEKKRKLGTAER